MSRPYKIDADGVPIPLNEADRLRTLKRQQVIDSGLEGVFNRTIRLALQLFETEIGLITFTDRNETLVVAEAGTATAKVPRKDSMCTWGIATGKSLVIPDATQDERFRDNPKVCANAGIRFYAGAMIVIDGCAIGTLCVADPKPRVPQAGHVRMLESMAEMVGESIKVRTRLLESLTHLRAA